MYKDFENELKQSIAGDVYFDEMHRKIYSVDASIYEVEPVGVIQPQSKEDVLAAIKIAANYQIPIIARGAATGITGGCLGRALIIDHSRYLNHVETINFHEKFAVCQPGVVQDTLNKILSIRHCRLGPDTSTGDRATLGGMMANNSAGARSLFYGKMVDHVIGIELMLSSGETLYFKEVDEHALKEKLSLQNTEGRIYREVCRIRDHYREDIQKHFPPIPRRVSGYNLDELLKPGPLNLCKLIVGSEGTLGLATQIKVNIAKMPHHCGLCLLFFASLEESLDSIQSIMQHQPLSLELIDEHIISRGRESPSMRNKLNWLKGSPHALLVAEFQASSAQELQEKLHLISHQMTEQKIGYEQVCMTDAHAMQMVWDLRKAGLGLLLSKRSYSRAIAFIEDLSIPPEKLPLFMKKFLAYLKNVGKEAGIYGHVGSGCMHIRPYIDMRDSSELSLMKKILEDVADLVLECQGALSGEHGDGIVRSWLNKKMFGDKIYQAFIDLKNAFDPLHLMNPGKIVEGPPFLENLRISPSTPISKIETFLDFSPEGGFELAVDLCNGNGLCRKNEGVMCPSFQATDNEYDSTRARAQALREMIHSPNPMEKFTDDALYDVLDLCLQCKGCKTECPSQVDMAKMKSEFLFHYQKKHGISLRTRIFGHFSSLLAWGSKIPRISNFMLSNPLSKLIMKKLGISTQRPFPKLALERFSSLPHAKQFASSRGQVVLFVDTYTEFISPEIGTSARTVLEDLGYEVITPSWKCCGRPLLTKGLLPEAKLQASLLVQHLLPYAQKDLFIVGLEPSCLFTIKDDYPSLLPKENLDLLLEKTISFEEFLCLHIENNQLPLPFNPHHSLVKYHIHCYQKSLKSSLAFQKVLNTIPHCDAVEIKSGCCGMAGSFGYENEHYDISIKIANLSLFPSIRHSFPHTLIISNGFSCRTQIEQGTPTKPLHLAQLLSKASRGSSPGPARGSTPGPGQRANGPLDTRNV